MRTRTAWLVDGLLAAAATAGGIATLRGLSDDIDVTAFSYAVLTVHTAALALRRRWPLPVLGTMILTGILMAAAGVPVFVPGPIILLAMYGVAASHAPAVSLPALATASGALAVQGLDAGGRRPGPSSGRVVVPGELRPHPPPVRRRAGTAGGRAAAGPRGAGRTGGWRPSGCASPASSTTSWPTPWCGPGSGCWSTRPPTSRWWPRRPTARRRSRRSTRSTPMSSSWTSACRSWTGWRRPGASPRRTRRPPGSSSSPPSTSTSTCTTPCGRAPAVFLLKDAPPADLLEAIRVVAAGDVLLSPRITRRLIEEFARRPEPDRPPPDALAALTEREREVLVQVARGLSNAEIAGRLYMSAATAKTHVSHLPMKLEARDRAQLVVLAYETGIVTPGVT